MSSPPCCQQHSEEVCESCVVKTTLTAENVVEANKLSNNYKVGARPVGGEHPWVPLYGHMGFFFFLPPKIPFCSSASRSGRAT